MNNSTNHEKLLTDQDVARHMQGLLAALDDKQALDVVSIDVSQVSSMADYFVICSGNSRPHTQALSQAVDGYLEEQGLKLYGLEGQSEGSWILIDAGFAIIHIMQESLRSFYDLEQLWSHAQNASNAQ
jgi:ribosome-associated protein